jgi:hypothetical protein
VRLKEILFTMALSALLCAAWLNFTVPDQDIPQEVTVEQLQEQIRDLEAENQRQQEEIDRLEVSHEYAICVSEDLDSRLGRVEGRW